MKKIRYDEKYYAGLIKQYGYDPLEFGAFDFDVGAVSNSELNLRYLCHQNAVGYLQAPMKSRVILTGFGMSGVPHLGSISQIMHLISFQDAGENCQLVLGDLDAYNGRGVTFPAANALAHHFKAFVVRLGFNKPNATIRIQSESPSEIKNFYLLGRYSTDESLAGYEEDIHELYVDKGVIQHEFNFPRRMSLMLMVSDFVSAGQQYDSVMGIVGIDEHKYVRYVQEILSRMNDNASGLRSGFSLACIYTRLNKGFGKYPKMSKSFPDSGIKVTDSPDKIRRLLRNEPTPSSPYDSLIFQLMVQLHYLDFNDVPSMIERYGHKEWRDEVDQFIDYIVGITRLWDEPQ